MTDIVERLRRCGNPDCQEAADDIKRLRMDRDDYKSLSQTWEAEFRSMNALVFEKNAEIERLKAEAEQAWIAAGMAADENERLRALLHRWVVSCAEHSHDLWMESRNALGDKP